ncbi:MAG TPA: thiazole synthase [Bdellovibrionota bacterium]|nr:thiazole synthase [Bdellovibrionota bacterium]
MENDFISIGKRTWKSRLFVGTGKYRTFEEMRECLDVSGAEVVTVAVRRINLDRSQGPSLLDYVDRKKFTLLPNTAGCYTAKDAIYTARLAREAGLSDLIKLEVIGDEKTLFPDNEATIEAAKELTKDGFTVLPYIGDDVIVAKKLENLGCAAVMPLAAPIGSGLGIRNPTNLILMKEAVRVPVIVDAGVGTASDAAVVMELGMDGVLMNTGIAGAKKPLQMARAMRLAVESGRLAFLSGRIPRKLYASASSPMTDVPTFLI